MPMPWIKVWYILAGCTWNMNYTNKLTNPVDVLTRVQFMILRRPSKCEMHTYSNLYTWVLCFCAATSQSIKILTLNVRLVSDYFRALIRLKCVLLGVDQRIQAADESLGSDKPANHSELTTPCWHTVQLLGNIDSACVCVCLCVYESLCVCVSLTK